MSYLLSWPAIDEIAFTIKYLKDAYGQIPLDKLSGNKIKKVPDIIGAHPLVVVRSGDGINSSILPIVGVESVSARPEDIGIGVYPTESAPVTQSLIDAWRGVPDEEKLFLQSDIDAIESEMILREQTGGHLYVKTHSLLEDVTMQISVWSADYEVTRLLKRVMRTILIEMYRILHSRGAKPGQYEMMPNLYNFEFGETLFGFEVTIPMMYRTINYIIDTGENVIKGVELARYNEQTMQFHHGLRWKAIHIDEEITI